MSMGWTVEDLQKLMDTPAELDPELVAYVDPDGPLGPALRHPLVYNVLVAPQMNAMMNEQLKGKKEALREYRAVKNWSGFVFAHERPWRIDAFVNICRHLGDSAYWKLLSSIYTDTENLWQNFDTWVECLTAERRYRSHMMTDDERGILKYEYDPTITVYRGYHEGGMPEGLSWTTNLGTANFFARRLAPEGAMKYIATGKVQRRDVLAHFIGRREYEMVVLPGHVFNIETEEMGVGNGRTA